MWSFKNKFFGFFFLITIFVSSVSLANEEEGNVTVKDEICSEVVNNAYIHCLKTITTTVRENGNLTETRVRKKTWFSMTKEGLQREYPVFSDSDFLRAEKVGEDGVLRPYKEVISSLWGWKLVNYYKLTYSGGEFKVIELDPFTEDTPGPIFIILLLLSSVIVTANLFAESFHRVTAYIILVMVFGVHTPLLASIFVFYIVMKFSSSHEVFKGDGGLVFFASIIFALATYHTTAVEMTLETRVWAVGVGLLLIVVEYVLAFRIRSLIECIRVRERVEELKVNNEIKKLMLQSERWWFQKFLDRLTLPAFKFKKD
ncbi:MAG: hypothetical protein R3B60_00205 [Candidatus Paceibacterota bacterium]